MLSNFSSDASKTKVLMTRSRFAGLFNCCAFLILGALGQYAVLTELFKYILLGDVLRNLTAVNARKHVE